MMRPVPWEQLVDTADGMFGDAGEDIGKPGLGIDVVEAAGLNQRKDDGGALPAAVGAGEEPRLPAQGHHWVILPMSGRWWSFIIVGIRFTVSDFGMKGARIAPGARLSG